MHLRLFGFAAALLSFVQLATAQTTVPSGLPQAVPGEFVIKLRNSEAGPALAKAMAASDSKAALIPLSAARRTFLVRTTPPGGEVTALATQDLRAKIATSPVVEVIEPNYIYRAFGAPHDPRFADEWHLTQIGATKAWDTATGSPSIIVAVIDTGVFWEHEDLSGNIWTNKKPNTPNSGAPYVDDLHGWNFYSNTNDVTAEKVHLLIVPGLPILGDDPAHMTFEVHGTHVAGIIGSVGNNKIGTTGVSWNLQIMPLKFMGGSATEGTLANAEQAIDYAIQHGARIINMSWGNSEYSQILYDAIKKANDAGVLVVAAAGNGDGTGKGIDDDAHPVYPASYDLPNLIAVASTNEKDALSSTSNFGSHSVHVAAPGVDILSTIPVGDEKAEKATSGYDKLSGTSMAAPVVSGMAALLMERYPTLTHLEIKKLILKTCDPLPDLSGKTVTGGRVNLAKALSDLPLPPAIADVLSGLSVERASIAEKHLTPELRAQLFVRDINPVISAPLAVASATTQPNVTREFVVKLDPKITPEDVAKAFASEDVDLKIVRMKPLAGNTQLYQFDITAKGSGTNVIEKLKKHGAIQAERNTTYSPQLGD